MTIEPRLGDALILVDVQNDFLPGGALAVSNGDAVIEPLNEAIEQFREHGLPIFATRDWHPANHCSFRAQGGPWPPHCVQDSNGAAISPALALPGDAILIAKGTDADADAYSGFQGTELELELRQLTVHRLYIGGLATDYCVKQTVLDARKAGFDVLLLTEGMRGIDPVTIEEAMTAMIAAGAVPFDSSQS